MMNEVNEKKIAIIFFLLFLVVLFIVIASFNKSFFKIDTYDYDLPNNVTTKAVNKTVDRSYKDLDENEKVYYNELLNKDLLAINNAIKNLNYYNINLIQSEESKFIYAYTKLKLESKENINLEMLNKVISDTFNHEISDNYIKNYFNGKEYLYNYDKDYTFCLKAFAKKEENGYLYLKFDLLDYDDELCNTNTFNYNTNNKEGILTYNVLNGKYYIDSFKIMRKEG